MHVLTSLIAFSGCVFVLCFGLVKIIWDLSEISIHASPDVSATPPNKAGGAEAPRANEKETSTAGELSDAQNHLEEA
jgi:hypothetical protein